MHIPDGYLSPIIAGGLGIITVPTVIVATRRVRKVLNHRTVPLLAIFAALSFTIMLFNVPVPGGTSTHAVGGTLIAILLGPEAAIVSISAVLVMQALFFGDGGVTAIFANALNLAIILPVVGYFSYRLIAGRSPILSLRRVWAAGIGSYIGIMAASLAVGIELGIEPIFFSQNGHALYFPYPLSTSVPAMLLATGVSGGIIEAFVTALGLAYIQKSFPQYLTSLRPVVSGSDVPAGQPVKIPLWQILTIGIAAGVVLLVVVGVITGRGNISQAFGYDWTQTNWADVGSALLVILVMGAIFVPLAWYLAPKGAKRAVAGLTAVAVLLPLGLIAPPFSFLGSGPDDFKQHLGYIPSGFTQLATLFNAPLANYNLPFDFFSNTNAPLWHAALGYEISGFIGICLVAPWVIGLATLVRRMRPDVQEITIPAEPDAATSAAGSVSSAVSVS